MSYTLIQPSKMISPLLTYFRWTIMEQNIHENKIKQKYKHSSDAHHKDTTSHTVSLYFRIHEDTQDTTQCSSS